MDRIKEIETRLAEIRDLLQADDADLDALEEEVRTLNAEKAEINDKAEQRARLLEDVAKNGETMRSFEEEEMEEKRTFGVETVEYRNAFLKKLQGKELDVEERTAVTASGAIPTITENKIVGKLELNPLLAAVDMTHFPGGLSIPVEGTVNNASWVAMGTAATDSADTISTVTLSAYKLIKTVEITADVKAMAIDAFEAWLVARLANKIERALCTAIISGSGTSQASGLNKTISTATGSFTKAGMTYKELMAIISALPTKYGANATFVMDRKTFYSDILGMQTTDGVRIVVADAQSPAKFNILGYPVILEDECVISSTDTVFFGDLKEYKLNFASDISVEADDSVAFRTGSRVYRAMTLADGQLADSNAVVKYTRKAS